MQIEKNEAGFYEAEVDGKKYEFQKWGAEDSYKILTRIAKIVAEPLGLLAGHLAAGSGQEMKKLLDMDFKPEMISDAVRALMLNMDESVSLGIVKKLASENVMCDGKKVDFNRHYQDQLAHLFKVVRVAVEVQYGNFFVALGELLGQLGVKKASTPARLTSTG